MNGIWSKGTVHIATCIDRLLLGIEAFVLVLKPSETSLACLELCGQQLLLNLMCYGRFYYE